MRLIRYIFLILLLAPVVSCYTTPEEPPYVEPEKPDKPDPGKPVEDDPVIVINDGREAYTFLVSRFMAGDSFISLDIFSSGLDVTFSDKITLSLSKGFSVSKVAPGQWPAIRYDGSRWLVDGVSAGVGLSDPGTLVATIYDGDGLYFWLNDGSIIFFHREEVRDLACFFFDRQYNPQLTHSFVGTIDGGRVTIRYPEDLSRDGLTATVAARGIAIQSLGKPLVNSITSIDYTDYNLFRYVGFDSAEHRFFVDFELYDYALPVLYIDTFGVEMIGWPSRPFIDIMTSLEDPKMRFMPDAVSDLKAELRYRGNATMVWYEKKPYKLKLKDKCHYLGLSYSKHFALMANAGDKTHIRNAVAQEFARMVDLMWANRSQFIEVYKDNEYIGIYQVTETNRVEEGRVEIPLATRQSVAGGYYMELDARSGGIITPNNIHFRIRQPENLSGAQTEYVRNIILSGETAIYSGDIANSNYRDYVDIVSFAANYIVQEITKNKDGPMALSNFLIIDNGVLKHSNVWDFDLSLGNGSGYKDGGDGTAIEGPTSFYIKGAPWYKQMFDDPVFVAEVRRQWDRLYADLDHIYLYIDELSATLYDANNRNFRKWDSRKNTITADDAIKGAYLSDIDDLKSFIMIRAEWLNTEFAKLPHWDQ